MSCGKPKSGCQLLLMVTPSVQQPQYLITFWEGVLVVVLVKEPNKAKRKARARWSIQLFYTPTIVKELRIVGLSLLPLISLQKLQNC